MNSQLNSLKTKTTLTVLQGRYLKQRCTWVHTPSSLLFKKRSDSSIMYPLPNIFSKWVLFIFFKRNSQRICQSSKKIKLKTIGFLTNTCLLYPSQIMQVSSLLLQVLEGFTVGGLSQQRNTTDLTASNLTASFTPQGLSGFKVLITVKFPLRIFSVEFTLVFTFSFSLISHHIPVVTGSTHFFKAAVFIV